MTLRRTGIAATLLLVAIALTACSDDGAVDPPPVAVPSSAPPRTALGQATLTFPAGDGDVSQCEIFKGTANLPPDKTLILGVRNVDNGSPERYFEAVENWEYPEDLTDWQGMQWFGSKDSSVDQRFRVEVLIVDLEQTQKAVRAAKNKGWHSVENPAGARVAEHLTLKRVAGPGPAECS